MTINPPAVSSAAMAVATTRWCSRRPFVLVASVAVTLRTACTVSGARSCRDWPANVMLRAGLLRSVLVDFGLSFNNAGLGDFTDVQRIGNGFLRLPEPASQGSNRGQVGDVTQLVTRLAGLSGRATGILTEVRNPLIAFDVLPPPGLVTSPGARRVSGSLHLGGSLQGRRQDQPYASTDPGGREGASLSRRTLLGAGAVVGAGWSLNLAEPASGAPAGPPKPRGEVPFGPVVVTDPGSGAAYARAVRLENSRTWLASYQQFGAARPSSSVDPAGSTATSRPMWVTFWP